VILDLERFQAQGGRVGATRIATRRARKPAGRRLNLVEADKLQEIYAQTAADLNRVTHGALART